MKTVVSWLRVVTTFLFVQYELVGPFDGQRKSSLSFVCVDLLSGFFITALNPENAKLHRRSGGRSLGMARDLPYFTGLLTTLACPCPRFIAATHLRGWPARTAAWFGTFKYRFELERGFGVFAENLFKLIMIRVSLQFFADLEASPGGR